jgi:Rrf2 family transcriptional regulator, nitric oxide-sensitive transcriptional repressor
MLKQDRSQINTTTQVLETRMRLAEYTDHTLRVLMYCAADPDRLITVGEMAESHEISKNNLMKIVSDLARQGLIETSRGRSGGVRLLKPASEIRIGDVVRATETDFRLVECFDERTTTCTMTASCGLKGVFDRALRAYLRELDDATVADVVRPRRAAASRGRVIPIHETRRPPGRAAAKRPAKR